VPAPPPLSPRSPDESFSARLRRLRGERRLSQRQLSAAGISYAYISRLEAGDRQPSVRAIRLLARALGVTPEYLETGIDIPLADQLELRLADAELRLRLGDDDRAPTAVLREVLAEADAVAETELAARARIALGLAAFNAGSHAEAVEHLSAAVAAPSTDPVAHSSVYLTLASAHRFTGRPERAVEVLESAINRIEDDPAADAGIQIRLAVALSGALSHIGEFAAARTVLREAASFSDPDPRSQVRLVWSRALLSYREGRPRIAVRDMRRAIALLDQTEDSVELARAHLFCAEVSLWGGDLDLAQRHLPLAAQLRALPAEVRDLGVLESCEALLHARRAEHAAAETRARAALDALREAPADQGIAWTALALSLAGRGDLDEAADAFANGVAALIASEEYGQAASVSHEWKSQLQAAGQPTEPADAAARASELASRAGLAQHARG
jgi:transcriptional regulator with XRE-family HTH domain